MSYYVELVNGRVLVNVNRYKLSKLRKEHGKDIVLMIPMDRVKNTLFATSNGVDHNASAGVLTAEMSTLDVGKWSGRVPKRIVITSRKTGESRVFYYDEEAAIANEFWDGEMFEYRPVSNEVRKLVVLNT